MSDIDTFIEKRQQIPIPSNPNKRIRLLARELAEGAHFQLWETLFELSPSDTVGSELIPISENLRFYLKQRWGNIHFGHKFDLLRSYGFINERNSLSVEAFALLDDSEPSTIFISYKRRESSAFALLVLARLKEYNLEPFVDMSLRAGEDWHEGLESQIKSRDYFIILLGKETLNSDVTVKEIGWAIQYDKTIIPVWHNDFEYAPAEWTEIPSDIANAIGKKHAIRVLEESASGYNTAVVELLNHFDITP